MPRARASHLSISLAAALLAAGCSSPAQPPVATVAPAITAPAAPSAAPTAPPTQRVASTVPAVAATYAPATAAVVPTAAAPTRQVTQPPAAPSATAAVTSAPAPTRVAGKATAPEPAPPFARVTASDGRTVTVKLEVADTPESRTRGLSRRESMPEDAGMLFVFPEQQQGAFWMKDTLIPLSIAFISSDRRILEIQDMQPLSEELHRPARPYLYALEVNQGFFQRNGVAAGDSIEFQLGVR